MAHGAAHKPEKNIHCPLRGKKVCRRLNFAYRHCIIAYSYRHHTFTARNKRGYRSQKSLDEKKPEWVCYGFLVCVLLSSRVVSPDVYWVVAVGAPGFERTARAWAR